MDNKKIELVKSYTLLRYSDREINEMYSDFKKVLINIEWMHIHVIQSRRF